MKNVKSNIVKACADFSSSRTEIRTIEHRFQSDHPVANFVILGVTGVAGLLAGNLVEGAIRGIAGRQVLATFRQNVMIRKI